MYHISTDQYITGLKRFIETNPEFFIKKAAAFFKNCGRGILYVSPKDVTRNYQTLIKNDISYITENSFLEMSDGHSALDKKVLQALPIYNPTCQFILLLEMNYWENRDRDFRDVIALGRIKQTKAPARTYKERIYRDTMCKLQKDIPTKSYGITLMNCVRNNSAFLLKHSTAFYIKCGRGVIFIAPLDTTVAYTEVINQFTYIPFTIFKQHRLLESTNEIGDSIRLWMNRYNPMEEVIIVVNVLAWEEGEPSFCDCDKIRPL